MPPGALVKPKDPLEYDKKLAFHSRATSAAELRARTDDAGPPSAPQGEPIYTDGSLQGVIRAPAAGGRSSCSAEREKEMHGGEAVTTNNRHGA